MLNNMVYTIDSDVKKIPIRYPRFDTLQIIDKSWRTNIKIVCNFKPDSSYSFFINCCGMTDIAATWRFNHIKPFDSTETEEAMRHELLDRPYFIFKIKNGTRQDSIYAWYQDHACFPSFKLIDKTGWAYGVPQKCFYWNNISPLTFFKIDIAPLAYADETGVIKDIYPEDEDGYEHLGTLYVRIFDNDTYVVTYDGKTQKITMRKRK